MMQIRTIRPDDAEHFLNLCHQLDRETPFMLLEVGERITTVEEKRRDIEQLLSQQNQTILVAEDEGILVGYVEATGAPFQRIKRTVYLVTGIIEAYRGRGLGTQLFTVLEQWARTQGLHRLELTVMAANRHALALYQKRGFHIEGTRREALFIDGNYSDEYYMAKLL